MHSWQVEGKTAVGPALLVSLELAGRIPGSKVIMCTDGLANIGLGSSINFDDGFERSHEFYSEVIEIAKNKAYVIVMDALYFLI